MLKNLKLKHFVIIICFVFFDLFLMLLFWILNLKGVTNSTFNYYYLSAFLGAVFLLLGWTIPNHFDFSYRKKSKDYKGKLPIEIRVKKFIYRFIFFIIGFFCLAISVIFSYMV